jgi:hypothetical protein
VLKKAVSDSKFVTLRTFGLQEAYPTRARKKLRHALVGVHEINAVGRLASHSCQSINPPASQAWRSWLCSLNSLLKNGTLLADKCHKAQAFETRACLPHF